MHWKSVGSRGSQPGRKLVGMVRTNVFAETTHSDQPSITVLINDILLCYNSLPCGIECFTGCREELRPTSKKKRHLFLVVASGCRHVICPLCYNFSRWSPPSYNLWEVFTAFFFLYLSAVLLLNVPVYVFHLLLYKAHSGQFSALPLL